MQNLLKTAQPASDATREDAPWMETAARSVSSGPSPRRSSEGTVE